MWLRGRNFFPADVKAAIPYLDASENPENTCADGWRKRFTAAVDPGTLLLRGCNICERHQDGSLTRRPRLAQFGRQCRNQISDSNQILKSQVATTNVANDFIDGIGSANMDVFLEDDPALPGLPLISRISVAYPLQSDSAEGLIREAEQLHQRGIRYVCVRRQQILFIGEHVIHDILADAGITVSCLGFAGGFTGSLGMSFEAATRDARRSIDLAADLGARSVVIVPGEQGLHTYRHAEKTIRLGLMDVAQYASQRHIRLLIPTDTVLISPNDCFRPRECPLTWLDGMGSPLIRPLIVVRGKSFACRLPTGWRESLAAGGSLRICHRCERYDENAQLVARVLTFISRSSGMNGFDKLLPDE